MSTFSSPLGPVEEAKIPEVSINLVMDSKFIPGTVYTIDWDKCPSMQEQIENKYFPLMSFATKSEIPGTASAYPFLLLKYVTVIKVSGKEPSELADKELIRSMGLNRVAFDIMSKADNKKILEIR